MHGFVYNSANVEVEEVQRGLSKIKLTKAVGPDNVPHKILRRVGYIPSSTSYFYN